MSTSLPPNANLTQLKHQAKDLLKAHKHGDPACCSVLRQLRQFADLSDADILSAKMRLDDAQFALAMHYGFESWAALKAHVEAVSGEKAMSAIVFGLVTSAATDESIHGAEVSFELLGPSYRSVGDGCVYTGADGRYECLLQWRGVERPELCYQCRHAAHACVGYWATESGPDPQHLLRLGDGEQHEINISLKEGYTLELTVENDRKEPVRDAQIVFLPEGVPTPERFAGMGDGERHLLTWPKTDAGGHCRIEGLHAHLSPGYQCAAEIRHPDYRRYILADIGALPREGHVVRATIQLPKGVSLNGQVICAKTGRPIEGAYLHADPQPSGTAQSDPDESLGNSATTGADGRFEIPGLLACPHDMIVRDDGWIHKELKSVDVPSGEPLMIRLERGRVITGQVIDREGRPAAKARIDAFGPGTHRHIWENVTQADDSGRFEIGGLSVEGPVCITASCDDGLCGVKEVSLDERHLVFDARKLVELDGVVVDETGQPVPARVLCSVGMDRRQEGVALGLLPVSDADGVFRVRVPANGSVQLCLRSHEDLTTSPFYNNEPITMHEGRPDRSLIFKANPPCKLALKFLDAQTGQPVSDLWIGLDTSVCLINSATDDQGRTVFENLPRHDAKLSASAPGYEDVRGERIALPTDEEIVIRLTPKA